MMRRMGLACASLILVYAVVVSFAHADTVSPQEAADPFEPVFTLEEPLSVRGMGGVSLNTVSFRLPPRARQGTAGWYVLDLSLQAMVDPSVGMGARNYVSVDTNGRTAAQIKFTTDEVAGQPAVRWSTYELFTGSASGIVFSESVMLPFRNYLQIKGVRPGTNDFTLRLEQPAGVVVASARLLRGSGVYYGKLGPSHLRLGAFASSARVRVGDILSIRYYVANDGFPARDVGLIASTSGKGLAATGATSRFLGWVPDEDEGVMSFVALAPGRYDVVIEARSETGGVHMETINVDVAVP